MNRRVIRSLLSAVVLAVGTVTAEQPPMVTDRPDQTESTAIVPVGRVQLETGWNLSRDGEGGVLVEHRQTLSTLLRFGLGERVELRVDWDGRLSQEVREGGESARGSGAGDAGMGAKVRLASEAGLFPEMALIAGVSVPSGDDAFTSERADPSIRMAFSHGLGERWSLGYNVEVAWESLREVGGDRDRLSFWAYTIALGVALDDRVGVYVESFGDIAGSAPGGPSHSLDGGFTWLVRPNLQFDVEAGIGLSKRADDWFAGVGLSVRFPR